MLNIFSDYLWIVSFHAYRLALFFVEPLGSYDESEKILEGTVETVQMEYFRRSNIDSFRVEEVEKEMAQKNHPYCHLFNGKILRNILPLM